MNELELIDRLTRSLPVNESVITGAGDDCAVLDLGLPDRWGLLKIDAVVEGIHFLKEAPPRQVGHKALARCLSDIAAMAGTPHHAVIALGLPPDFPHEYLDAVYEGIGALAEHHRVAIVGGEITRLPERLSITVAMTGSVGKQRCVLRSGAQVGDAILVTGELGGSIQGKHLDFQPRLEEASWLADHFPPHAMIDLSDGLASDLRHILSSSGRGAELLASAIPISPVARAKQDTKHPSRPPLTAALCDGEDYELLFTVGPQQTVPLRDAWIQAFPRLKISCIGRITEEPGVRMRTHNRLQPLTEHGFLHFP
jgi:thiamine-monophosphate kinase